MRIWQIYACQECGCFIISWKNRIASAKESITLLEATGTALCTVAKVIFSNAKYWFRHVGEHEAFDTIDEAINECEKLFTTQRLTDLASGGYDPFELVDHCRAVDKASSEMKTPSDDCDHLSQDDLRVFLHGTHSSRMVGTVRSLL